MATVELSAAAALNHNFDAELVLLYEEGENDDNIAVDVATLNGRTTDEKFGFSVGRMYVPFGVYETGAISDPYGLEIGETQDEAILLSADFDNGISAAIWGANNSNTSDNNGTSFAYVADNFALGVDTIRHVAGANSAKGLAVHGHVNFGDITLIVEQISEREGGNKAKATQLEVDYGLGDWAFALVNNNIDNDGDYDNVRTFAIGYVLAESATFALEYSIQNRVDNTGDDKAATLQLAYEF